MESVHNLQLIDGNFTPSEATEVLLALMDSKIKFNKLSAFIIEERFNGDASGIQSQMQEMKEVRTSLQSLLSTASAKGLKLKVNSYIEITTAE